MASAIAVLRSEGFGGTTTRAIAQHAGVAEGSIYRYFADKIDLIQTAIREYVLPELLAAMEALPGKAGTGRVGEHLQNVLGKAFAVYSETIPHMAALCSDQQILARYREAFLRKGFGPHRSFEPIATYLRAEQALGRVPQTFEPEAAAVMLLGSCYHQALLGFIMGPSTLPYTPQRLIEEIVRVVVRSSPRDHEDEQHR